MKRKIHLAIVFGGKSVEHEISLRSACTVIDALDPNKYDLTLIGIDKIGRWHIQDPEDFIFHRDDLRLITLGQKKGAVEVSQLSLGFDQKGPIDVVFPVLHGPLGEDGTIQGLLKLAGLPFVGAGVLSSALIMDKEVTKRLLRGAGFTLAKDLTFYSHKKERISYQTIVERLSLPFFVKPANGGSSVGITKVKNEEMFDQAVALAFQYDRKILVEACIKGREVQCAVLGNEEPIASLPCEIIPKGEYHSYESKYMEGNAEFIIPAKLTAEEISLVQKTAIEAFQVLECEGMARVDLFLTPEGTAVIYEVNTIPGLTKLSPFGRMWKASGIDYPELMDHLIALALDRFERELQLQTNYTLDAHLEVR